MILVPLQDLPSQVLDVQLANQNCTLRVYQRSTGLYVDVLLNGALVIGGVAARNLNRIVRNIYLGFVGDLTFFDTVGRDDPAYPGLGQRYQLIYLDAAELGGRLE